MISWHLLFSSSSIKTFSTLRSDRVHVLPVWLIGDMHTYTHTNTHLYMCLPWPKYKHVCLRVFVGMFVCVCVRPTNSSSLLSECRFSKDSWVHFRCWSRSEVRHWCRWPLVLRPPSSSCQINQSHAEWFGEHDIPPSLPRTLSFCFPSLSLCLSVCFTLFNLSHMYPSQQQPIKPHLAHFSPLDMNNTATLKILSFICGVLIVE